MNAERDGLCKYGLISFTGVGEKRAHFVKEKCCFLRAQDFRKRVTDLELAPRKA